MEQSEILDAITDLGLSQKESQVYLAAVTSGPTNIKNLSRLSGVNRTTIYPIFERLKSLGLMSLDLRGFKKFYVAESPQRLKSILETKQQKFFGVIDQLQAMYTLQPGDTQIKSYEGLAAIKSVYESLLTEVKAGEDYLIISSGLKWYELDPKFFDKFLARRALLDIKVRAIMTKGWFSEIYKKKRTVLNEKVRLFPESTNFTANIVVIPSKIVIHQLEDPVWAMVIENKNIITVFQQIFEFVWNQLTESN